MTFIDVKVNIPFEVTFKYDTHTAPKQGKFGDFVCYGVESNSGDMFSVGMNTSLYGALKALEPLKGKTLRLEKRQLDGKKTAWYVNDQMAGNSVNPPPGESKPELKDDKYENLLFEVMEVKTLVKAIHDYMVKSDQLINGTPF